MVKKRFLALHNHIEPPNAINYKRKRDIYQGLTFNSLKISELSKDTKWPPIKECSEIPIY